MFLDSSTAFPLHSHSNMLSTAVSVGVNVDVGNKVLGTEAAEESVLAGIDNYLGNMELEVLNSEGNEV